METPRCPKIPNTSADWKLNPNVDCRIILNKLKIKTPEYETMELCRTLTNTINTKDKDVISEFILDVLFNDFLRKCDEKCGLCEEYIQQLRHHIIQAHTVKPNALTVFKCDICSSIYSSPSMLIRHRNTHSDNSDTLTTVQCEDNHPQHPIWPKNREWNTLNLKHESSHSESELEIPNDFNAEDLRDPPFANSNPLEILQNMNNFLTIAKSMKQESDDVECQEEDSQDPSFVKFECTEMSTESEEQTVCITHENSSNDTTTGSESFPVPSDLITHKTTQSVQKPHKCDRCGKCFGNLHHLSRHKLTHSGKNPHKCGVCGKCFRRSDHFIQHKLTHTGVTRPKPHECSVRGKFFARQSDLTHHKRIHTGERPYKCDVCGNCFAHKFVLVRHKRTHTGEKPFRCDVCGKDFAQTSGLAVHKLTHASENTRKLYKCDVCGKFCTIYSNLTQHKLTHTGEKQYRCDECGNNFSTKSQLTQHKLLHTGEKRHKCDVCGMCFARKFVLTRHRWTHTKETQFHCDECGQSFSGRYKLNQHKRKNRCPGTTTTTTIVVSHLKEERESEEEGCQENPLLNLDESS